MDIGIGEERMDFTNKIEGMCRKYSEEKSIYAEIVRFHSGQEVLDCKKDPDMFFLFDTILKEKARQKLVYMYDDTYVSAKEILYIEANGAYTNVCLKGESRMIRRSLKDWKKCSLSLHLQGVPEAIL